MKKTKKVLINIVIMMLVSFSLTSFAFADYSKSEATTIYKQTKVTELKAKAYALLDCATGKTVFKNNEKEHINVGYLSQLMTLFMTYERCSEGKFKSDAIVTVSKEAQAASNGKARVFLDAGKKEVISVDQAIKAVAICNAVDAAYALGEFVGGTVEDFVKMMNDKAKEIGMTDSLFTDPTGADREGQYTCASDLVTLGKLFIEKYPEILEYTKLTYGEFKHDSTGQPFTAMVSPNNLTRGKFYTESDGLGVGFSENSGYAMLATVEVEEKRVIACVLGEEDENYRAAEIKKLLEYGLSNFEYRIVSQKGTFVRRVNVVDGKKKRVDIYTAEDFGVILEKSQFKNLKHDIVMYGQVTAPVAADTEVGEIVYTVDGEEVGKVKIVCTEKIERANWFTRLIRKILKWLGLD